MKIIKNTRKELVILRYNGIDNEFNPDEMKSVSDEAAVHSQLKRYIDTGKPAFEIVNAQSNREAAKLAKNYEKQVMETALSSGEKVRLKNTSKSEQSYKYNGIYHSMQAGEVEIVDAAQGVHAVSQSVVVKTEKKGDSTNNTIAYPFVIVKDDGTQEQHAHQNEIPVFGVENAEPSGIV